MLAPRAFGDLQYRTSPGIGALGDIRYTLYCTSPGTLLSLGGYLVRRTSVHQFVTKSHSTPATWVVRAKVTVGSSYCTLRVDSSLVLQRQSSSLIYPKKSLY